MKKIILVISIMFTMQNAVMANLNNDILILINNNIENIFELSSPTNNMDIKVIIDNSENKTISKLDNKESKKIIIKIKGKKRPGLKIVIGDGFIFRYNDYKFIL